ncbi:uncharacterized protein LY89DRAFT_664074 [Mollisia scopiformis]|uniref:Uncharacterized protein n=1 Tax=Mollisia scopiformis TaxID=149040 RepID=A0A194XR77_MOLSC|nr:uncharacterized protein LY89DRAFT_664074 [Mollisia scopiformis]KUJ22232.1 hypothetical protein LY89DRAFT_664074 [Mollisia scopiformis]
MSDNKDKKTKFRFQERILQLQQQKAGRAGSEGMGLFQPADYMIRSDTNRITIVSSTFSTPALALPHVRRRLHHAYIHLQPGQRCISTSQKTKDPYGEEYENALAVKQKLEKEIAELKSEITDIEDEIIHLDLERGCIRESNEALEACRVLCTLDWPPWNGFVTAMEALSLLELLTERKEPATDRPLS